MAKKFAKSIALAQEMGKPLLLPSLHGYSDLFSAPTGAKKIVAVVRVPRTRGTMGISNWVSLSGKGVGSRGRLPHSFYADPKKVVLEAIDKNHVFIEYDEIYFKIIVRSPGEALVVSSHNKILGDRWIAFIDPKTIPSG